MNTFVRGRLSRTLCLILMVALMVPALLIPMASMGLAAADGRQNILLLPLQVAAPKAPYNLEGRIVRALQIALAQTPGVQVNELRRNSSILTSAVKQLDEEAQAQLYASYDAAANPATPTADRVKAAGELVRILGVDALVFGVIDQYEFTGAPDPAQTLIHATATKVTVDQAGAAMTSPVVVIGQSRTLPDGKGAQTIHDAEAIANCATSLAAQLSGAKAVATPATTGTGVATPPVAGAETPKVKKSSTWMWALLGGLAVAAAVGGGGSDSSASTGGNNGGNNGGNDGETTVDPLPAVVATVVQRVDTADPTNPRYYMHVTWNLQAPDDRVLGFRVYRYEQPMGFLTRGRYNETISAPGQKLPVSRTAHRGRGRAAAAGATRQTRVDPNYTKVLDITTATSYDDPEVADGGWYSYKVEVVPATAYAQLKSETSTQVVQLVKTPKSVTATTLTSTVGTTGIAIKWYAPVRNDDNTTVSSQVMVRSFALYRLTTPPAAGMAYSDAELRTLVPLNANIVWDGRTTEYQYDDTNLPLGGTYYYAVKAIKTSSMTGEKLSSQPTPCVAATWVVAPTPTSLTATATGPDAIQLTWPKVSGATAYVIERQQDGDTVWSLVTTVNETGQLSYSYLDTPLEQGTKYYYRLYTMKDDVKSLSSSASDETTDAAAPTGIVANAVSPRQIDLTWPKVDGCTGYEIERSMTDQTNWAPLTTITDPLATSYSDQNGLSPNTVYYYRIRATYRSVNSDWGQVGTARTPVEVLIGDYKAIVISDGKNKIYYSQDPDDQLASGTPVMASLTIEATARGNANAGAAGAFVTLTTSKGTFIPGGSGQTVTNGGKSISGVLDPNGRMYVKLCGRADDNQAKGQITLPKDAELGQTVIIADSVGNPDFDNDKVEGDPKTLTGAPTLVGPPARITLTVANVNQQGTPPVLFQNFTMQIIATVKDSINQEVLAGMPIWLVQSWKRYEQRPEAPFDHDGVVKPGNISYPTSYTDDSGKVTQFGFSSHSSGLYMLNAYALKKAFNEAVLNAITNRDLTDPAVYKPYLLPGAGTDSEVTESISVLNKTYVYYDQWQIVDISYPRINCDGSSTSRITFRGYDEDRKPVLPGVPYTAASRVKNFDQVSPDLKLEQDGKKILPGVSTLNDKTWIDANGNTTAALFNERSEGYVLSRGNNWIGQLILTFDNIGRLGSRLYTRTVDVIHYGPDLNAANAVITVTPRVPARITGKDHYSTNMNVAAHTQDTFEISITDPYGNKYPNGYRCQLQDDGVTVSTVGNALQIGYLIDGKVTLNYAQTLPTLSYDYRDNISMKLEGEDAAAAGAIDKYFIEDGIGVEMVRPSYTQSLYPANKVVVPLDFTFKDDNNAAWNASTRTVRARIYDGKGLPAFDGYRIYYLIEPLATTPNTPTAYFSNPAYTVTNATGDVNMNMNSGKAIAWYKARLEYALPDGTRQVLGTTSEIHAGLAAPTNAVASSPTLNSLTVSWTDTVNATGDVSVYQIERSYLQANNTYSAWALAGTASGTARTFVDRGLTHGTYYKYRVRAYTNQSGPDVYSDYTPESTPVRTDVLTPPTLTMNNYTQTTVSLSMSHSNVPSSRVQEYWIYRSTDNNNWGTPTKILASAGVTNYNASGLTANTTYYFRVTCWTNVEGTPTESAPSNVITQKTLP